MGDMLRGIVFDFDGVIADTEPLHFAAFAEALSQFDVPLSRETYFSRYLGLRDEEILRRLLADERRRLTFEQTSRLLGAKDAAYGRRIERGIDLAPGAAGLIRRASQRYSLAICSGSKRDEIEQILRQADLLRPFEVIVAAEDVTSSKPDPAGYALTLRRLQACMSGLRAEQCLAIEDSPAGVTAAKGAGMRVVAIGDGDGGFDVSRPDARIDNLAELSDGVIETFVE